MPIKPVLGPAGGGKSQWIAERMQPNDVLIDFSYLYRALKGTDAKTVRRIGDPIVPFVQAVKQAGVKRSREPTTRWVRHQCDTGRQATTGASDRSTGRHHRSGVKTWFVNVWPVTTGT